MEIFIDVFVEEKNTQGKVKTNEAIYTFVALDDDGNPLVVPEIVPESKEEIERFNGALRRKQLALILAGKMKPDDASELKQLFFPS
jgi:acyl-CoA hydrolase